ncbi:hypothetical protein F0A16_14135 [Salinicola corii]|uniref:Uncharacterized protein n=1 Tax=Salinicola corii TaxID=2606937 RepID=A0A640WDJ3_9GAMM|nr:hypothetical protein [Salinicola corii]KAA0017140.1 hypothetical protein F0A16_14135 [Salinicola corii]
MKMVSITPTAIKHRADTAARIGSALAGITTVLHNDEMERDEGRPALVDNFTRGNLFEALLALSDQATDLADSIAYLSQNEQEGQS